MSNLTSTVKSVRSTLGKEGYKQPNTQEIKDMAATVHIDLELPTDATDRALLVNEFKKTLPLESNLTVATPAGITQTKGQSDSQLAQQDAQAIVPKELQKNGQIMQTVENIVALGESGTVDEAKIIMANLAGGLMTQKQILDTLIRLLDGATAKMFNEFANKVEDSMMLNKANFSYLAAKIKRSTDENHKRSQAMMNDMKAMFDI